MMSPADDVISTLAHTAAPALAQGHHQWWRKWQGRVGAHEAPLREPAADERAACDAAGVTHVMDSFGGVRVGCRLTEPAGGEPVGGVVVLHGGETTGPILRKSPWADAGLTSLRLRVRGFEGSTFDTGNLCGAGGGWITQGLGDPETSALIGAIADVALAVRALQERVGGKPVSIRGDSLGGGLAVLAAANQLEDAPVSRLAIGLPSLGDWTARLLAPSASGTGADAAKVLRSSEDGRDAMRRTLRLADAVAHARRVSCPVLCLLAAEDPVVPPAAAAAIFNALGSDPGHKKRVMVPRGHESLATDELRQYAAFDELAMRFIHPHTDPLACLCEGGG